MGEVVVHDVVGTVRAVRVNRDLVDGGLYELRHRTALNAAEIEVRFIIDAPHLIRD